MASYLALALGLTLAVKAQTPPDPVRFQNYTLEKAFDAASEGTPQERRVEVQVDTYLDTLTVMRNGERGGLMVTTIQLSGVDGQPPLRIGIDAAPSGDQAAVNIVALQAEREEQDHDGMGMETGSAVMHTILVDVGRTILTNKHFINPSTGEGFVREALMATRDFADDATAPTSNIQFANQLLRRLEVSIPSSLSRLLSKGERYATERGQRLPGRVQMINVGATEPGVVRSPTTATSTRAFRVTDGTRQIIDISRGYPLSAFQQRGDPTIARTRQMNMRDEFRSAQGQCRGRRRGLERRCTPLRTSQTGGLVLARAKGIMTPIKMVTVGVAKTLGGASTIAAPVFIILDLVDKNYVGAAFGAIGLVLGVALGAMIAGPAGWLVAGAVSFLFAILPGLFKKRNQPPTVDNKEEVLQWALFGNKDHTGNEKCREQGEQNCQALYGAGVIAEVFKWDHFNAVTFLIEYNKGYAMSIPDIAEALHLVRPDYTEYGDDGGVATHTAWIECPDSGSVKDEYYDEDHPDVYLCSKPKFFLRREAIRIPGVNETADKVAERLITPSGGDCRLVNDAANALQLPDFNLTLYGEPVAIACNLTSTVTIDPGTPLTTISSTDTEAIDPANPSASSLSLISDGASSSDGRDGHRISAPPPQPFILLNETNAVCLGYWTRRLCLPNGTYDGINGKITGYQPRQTTRLSLPPQSTLTWARKTYSAPITSSDKIFTSKMRHSYGPLSVSIPSLPVPDVICLFASPHYKGDVSCYGAGAGFLDEGFQNKAQSIAVLGRASAVIYAESYGDPGGAEVTSSVADLEGMFYGNGNFGGNVVAMWVRVG
ncbi:MAG: hypothetical protein M1817_002521 [Caeruleum heppii]|nr:MAG: hypothetical protein M1817_002521 [Caeruleum heppii]